MAEKKAYFSSTRIAFIAIFAALTGVLHAFGKFPLSFAFPGFLEFDFADIPLLLGTFALGPVSGCIIAVVAILIKLVCAGTGSMFVGDLAKLLVWLAFIIPAGIVYKRFRTKKGALLAMLIGSASSVAVAILSNWLMLIPFYLYQMFGGNWEPLLGMMRALFPNITQATFYNYYLWVSVLPFNVLRCLIASLACFFVYKHISVVIERLNQKLAPKEGKEKAAKTRDIIILVVCIVVVLLLLLFTLLRYFLW